MTAEETIAALEVQLKQALERIDEVTEQLRVAQARIEELEKLKTPAPAFVKAEKKKPPEEQQRWGRDFAAALGRTTLTCLAFKTAQVYRLQAGEWLAAVAMRRRRRHHQRELGTAPALISVAGCSGVFALEALLSLLGAPARESLLPALSTTSSPDAPT